MSEAEPDSFEFGDDAESDDRLGEEDLFIQRDEEGDLLPVEQEVPQLGGTAKVIPMPYGQVERIFGGSGQTDQIESDQIADILRDHVVDPDLSGMSVKEMKESMVAMAPQALVVAVLRASGVSGDMNVNEEGEPEMEVDLGNRG